MYRDPRSDMPVTQFNMKWVEQAGLVKFDFLGLKTLTVLEDCRRFRRSKRDIARRLSKPCRSMMHKTYEMLSRARRSACSRWKVPACARR